MARLAGDSIYQRRATGFVCQGERIRQVGASRMFLSGVRFDCRPLSAGSEHWVRLLNAAEGRREEPDHSAENDGSGEHVRSCRQRSIANDGDGDRRRGVVEKVNRLLPMAIVGIADRPR